MYSADEAGESYAVQFHVADTERLNNWIEQEGQAIHKALAERFGDRVTGFTTLLEEIDWAL
jgi:hypothetical protein